MDVPWFKSSFLLGTMEHTENTENTNCAQGLNARACEKARVSDMT
jgi:hypothetical protein